MQSRFCPAKRDLMPFFCELWNNRIDSSVLMWEGENRTTALERRWTTTNKHKIIYFNFKLLRNNTQSLAVASRFFSTVVLATTALFVSFSLIPSSILRSIVDYPLNIMVSIVFSTRNLPSS